jgi:anti-sigma-K factor RskA
VNSSPDIHTATGAYAADALPPEEREEVEAHLAVCPACTQEVAELRATLTKLADAAAEAPPPALRERLLAEVARTRQQPPLVGAGGRRAGRWAWTGAPLQLAAAALLVVAVALGVLFVQQRHQFAAQQEVVAEISTVLNDPHHVLTTANLTSGGRGTAVVSGSRAVFLASGLASVPSNRTCQLWVMSPGSTRSAGLLGRGSSAQALVPNIRAGDRLGVTVEPAGGSRQPTTAPLVTLPIGT